MPSVEATLAKFVDHCAERQQTFVDVRAFLQSASLCARLARPLRAREVNQRKHADVHGIRRADSLVCSLRCFQSALNNHSEECVTSTRSRVHIRLAHVPPRLSLLHERKHLLWLSDEHLTQASDVDSSLDALVDLQFSLRRRLHILSRLSSEWRRFVEKVHDVLVVQLEVRDAYEKFSVCVGVQAREDVRDSSRYDSRILG